MAALNRYGVGHQFDYVHAVNFMMEPACMMRVPAHSPVMTAREFHRQAVVQRQSAQYAEAERACCARSNSSMICAAAHFELGLTYRDRGQLEDAADYFQLAVHFAPSSQPAGSSWAACWPDWTASSAARAAYREALARDARHAAHG